VATITIHHTDEPDVADHLAKLCTENGGTVATPEPGVTIASFDTVDQMATVAVPLGAALGRTITTMVVGE
jgi:hypothetical protein